MVWMVSLMLCACSGGGGGNAPAYTVYEHDMLDKMYIMISRKVAMENGIEATQ
jgi:hypothetical protein